MVGTDIKLQKFILDSIECDNKDSDVNKTDYIYNILISCSYNFEKDISDKKQITLYFTEEQLEKLKLKQEELNYDNFSLFVRLGLFNHFIINNNIVLAMKLIDCDKFKLLLNRCKNELINGKYTSYNLDLLRDNEIYKDKISLYSFNKEIKENNLNLDFMEYDMLFFIQDNFIEGKTYSELIGLSTNQSVSESFIEMEDGEQLESFIDYDNIVPDTNNNYYLWLYYIFNVVDEDNDFSELFNETDEHIEFLLNKYTIEKIIKYYKEKYDIIDVKEIFDKQCLKYLKSNNVINIK